jgi:beta-galactosidase
VRFLFWQYHQNWRRNLNFKSRNPRNLTGMIPRFTQILLSLAVANCALLFPLRAEVLTATLQTPPPAESGYFKLGANKNPSGREISVNSRSLLLDGRPWFPVMGEFHYTRVPQAEWRDELLKMKAAGVDIVATYVFWIHHEEIQGQWDWTGDRDLKKFLQTCNDIGLKVVVRCGPWCHGEVRNGGFPDWVQKSGWKLRSTDTNFLAAVKILYAQIVAQLRGELWKDGGAVIGIQVDNEFGGSPNYLMALKKMAVEAGIDVPFYTKTGWPPLKTPVPLGELLPLFGTYAEGFWEHSLQSPAGDKWQKFTFKILRTDTDVGNDTLKKNSHGDTAGTEKYPYLTCEIGGGMPASYHRRMNLDPRDVEAVALCQIGSGSSLMGYYMFHGGRNPEGKLTTLQESSATGYPNDLPVKNYDFNAPVGEYGQLNPQYFWLRRLHLFLHDFGGALAPMPATMPDVQPENKSDTNILRWSVRSDSHAGFVFVNNYERLRPLPAKTNVQFKLNLPGVELVFPQTPVTVPADVFFFWPFNLDLGGVKLIYATAQPICRDADTFYFAETPGVKADFLFDAKTLASPTAEFTDVKASRQPAMELQSRTGQEIKIVLLSEADSLRLGKNRHVFFETPPQATVLPVVINTSKTVGPAREIPLAGKSHLAVAPTDDDFTNAYIWRLTLPAKIKLKQNPLLRIRYVGDAARLTLNGKLIEDNFYCGRDFEIGLKRFAPEILTGDLRLEILPLRKDAPLFFEPKDRPDFGAYDTLLMLKSAEVIQ